MARAEVGDIGTVIALAGAALLVIAAIAKLRTPGPTASLLRRLRLPAAPAAVRVLGVGELTVAAVALVGGWAMLPLAVAYLAFTVVAVTVRWRAPRQSCGCFGSSDAPVTFGHVAVTAIVTAGAAVAAATGSGIATLGHSAVGTTTHLGQALLLTGIGYALLVIHPALMGIRRKATA
jgi:hypothetical protein